MRLVVIGAGGHAKVVVDAAQAAGLSVAGVVGQASDPTQILGIPVVGDHRDVEADSFIVAIGDNATREAAFDVHREYGLSPVSVIHPSAVLGQGVTIGAGTLIAAGVVINVDARIGENCIINTGCTVDHDCVVGDHAHIGPGAHLCGAVHVGSRSLMGVGSSAAPGARIGDRAVVGAGACVISEVPQSQTWAGVPARELRAESDANR